MTKEQPLISICIPTFNRSKTLDALLGDIESIKSVHSSEVEVCVSNNCSTDSTIEIIDKWARLFQIRLFNQVENVGATRNLQCVSALASGKWILLIGDDDGLDSNEFEKLFDILSETPDDHWIITQVVNQGQDVVYFKQDDVGLYSSSEFLCKLLQRGTINIGFIGSHIIPAKVSRQLRNMNADQIRPWPHVALMLENLPSLKINIAKCKPVIQAARESQLFWSSGDCVRNNLRLIDLLMTVSSQNITYMQLLDILAQKEMYSWSLVKELIKWRITEKWDYINNAEYEYGLRLDSMAGRTILHRFIFGSVGALCRVSDRTLELLLALAGKSDLIGRYMHNKSKLDSWSGVGRKM